MRPRVRLCWVCAVTTAAAAVLACDAKELPDTEPGVDTVADPKDANDTSDPGEPMGDPGDPWPEIEELFPFDENRPVDVVYQCARVGSQLAWVFDFQADGSVTVAFTTDAHEDVAFPASYTFVDGQIRLRMDGGPAMPFPAGLDETSTFVFTQFGILAGFTTPSMACVAIGHRYNEVEFGDTVHYDCPTTHIQAASYEDNALEFVHRAVSFSVPVPGSAFRHRDMWISGADTPNITRGYGIYRRDGDRFYVTFQLAADFADAAAQMSPIPLELVPPFADHNLLTGSFVGDNREATIDQLEPESGTCSRE